MDNKTADILIGRTAQGDMSALEELYNALSRGVYAFVMTIVKNPSVAEDIMQDTFVRVYNAAGSFRANDSGVSWIMRIARNLALNAVKSRIILPEEQIDEQTSAAGTESAAIDRVMIHSALEKLSDAEREIITLHAVMGMTLSEIAQITGEPLGTVKWRHSSALKKVRKYIGETEANEQ